MKYIFPWRPDRGYIEQSRARVLEAKFGDGYAQRTPDGLNNIDVELSMTFSDRPVAEIESILTFLQAHRGSVSFQWAPLDGEFHLYVCSEWSKDWTADTHWTLNATFNRDVGKVEILTPLGILWEIEAEIWNAGAVTHYIRPECPQSTPFPTNS
jgi:phage-related protein